MITPYLETTDPVEMGLNRQKWAAVLQAAEQLTQDETVPAIAVQVQRQGLTTGPHVFGRRDLSGENPADPQTRFLIASLTKPMVAMAVLLLVERGKLALNQRVSELIPDFKGTHKRKITLRNILTHTSGLPDMLPNNRELRAANSSLDEFVRQTAAIDVAFPPGQNSSYQSMGFALLGPIIENASGMSYRQFIQQELFEPLEMNRAALGLEGDDINDPNIAEARLPDEQVGEDGWNWNSNYWKTFGAPWGGTLATVEDVCRFSLCILSGGLTPDGDRLFNSATIDLATTNRLHDFPDMPEPVRRARGWGYGWQMNWLDHRGCFGDLLGPEVFGHWGATGTLVWLDHMTGTSVVILSTQPDGRSVSPLVRLSNMIAAAFE